jgi:nucleoid-associated protein YgaU
MSPQTPDFSNVRSGTSSVPNAAPDFSNVQSGGSTVGGAGGTGSAPADARHYTVQRGDTLSGIAQHVYGKASRWHAIFAANRHQIDDPDLIRPGQVLLIPADQD